MQEENLLSTSRFEVRRVTRHCADGTVREREVIRHPGSVVILPLLDDGRVCLIRNFRMAAERELIEIPAGTLEPDETPEACAYRELTEETGYRAGAMHAMTSFFAAPGILDELMHLFVATELTEGEPCREPGEEIENLILGRGEAVAMVERGEIQDAKTIIALLLLARGLAS